MGDETEQAKPEPGLVKLSELQPGETGRVREIGPAIRGPARRRLLDLGLITGTIVGVAFTSPAGNPTAYEIRGALIALRQEQAAEIELERMNV